MQYYHVKIIDQYITEKLLAMEGLAGFGWNLTLYK